MRAEAASCAAEMLPPRGVWVGACSSTDSAASKPPPSTTTSGRWGARLLIAPSWHDTWLVSETANSMRRRDKGHVALTRSSSTTERAAAPSASLAATISSKISACASASASAFCSGDWPSTSSAAESLAAWVVGAVGGVHLSSTLREAAWRPCSSASSSHCCVAHFRLLRTTTSAEHRRIDGAHSPSSRSKTKPSPAFT